MNIVFDTYAWIEYFEGSAAGEAVERYIESEHYAITTPSIVLAELSDAHVQGKVQMPWEDILIFIRSHSECLDLGEEIATKAGPLKKKLRMKSQGVGLIDAIILATTAYLGGTLLTGDPHLTGEEGVIDLSTLRKQD
jgi:predicted nucleic acid-binding protein|tara:strand:- start:263 stop:673 length:411 start_codon:yes stop_codon:yes gene_type:complete